MTGTLWLSLGARHHVSGTMCPLANKQTPDSLDYQEHQGGLQFF